MAIRSVGHPDKYLTHCQQFTRGLYKIFYWIGYWYQLISTALYQLSAKSYKTIPLSYLDGELFQADITCTADSTGNGKLMFKFNRTRILSQRGSWVAIIACM